VAIEGTLGCLLCLFDIETQLIEFGRNISLKGLLYNPQSYQKF